NSKFDDNPAFKEKIDFSQVELRHVNDTPIHRELGSTAAAAAVQFYQQQELRQQQRQILLQRQQQLQYQRQAQLQQQLNQQIKEQQTRFLQGHEQLNSIREYGQVDFSSRQMVFQRNKDHPIDSHQANHSFSAPDLNPRKYQNIE